MKINYILILLLFSLTSNAQSDYFIKKMSSQSSNVVILTPSICEGFLEGRRGSEVIAYDDVMLQPTSAIFRSFFKEDKLKEIDRIDKKRSGSMYWYVDSETGDVLSIKYYLSEELYKYMMENDFIGLTEKFLSYKFDMSKVEVVKPGTKGYWQFSLRFGMLILGKRKRDR